jgi:hypothetical protein
MINFQLKLPLLNSPYHHDYSKYVINPCINRKLFIFIYEANSHIMYNTHYNYDFSE